MLKHHALTQTNACEILQIQKSILTFTHWGLIKMADILQMTFFNTLSQKKLVSFVQISIKFMEIVKIWSMELCFKNYAFKSRVTSPKSQPVTVDSYIAVVYIAELDISRSHVGPHFLVPESMTFFEKSWQLLGSNSWERIFRKICSTR